MRVLFFLALTTGCFYYADLHDNFTGGIVRRGAR